MEGRHAATTAERVMASICPHTALVAGAGREALVTALRVRGCAAEDAAGLTGSDAPKAQVDVAIYLGGASDEDGERRPHIVDLLCGASDDVLLLARDPRACSQWSEAFASHGYFPDADFDAGFVGPGAMRFRLAATGPLENGRRRAKPKRRAEELESLYRLLEEKDRLITVLRRELAAHKATLGWRVLERFRGRREPVLRVPVLRELYWILRRALEVLIEEGFTEVVRKSGRKIGLALRGRLFLDQLRAPLARDIADQYKFWLVQHAVTATERRAMKSAMERFPTKPLVSILAVLETAELELLRGLLATLQAQIYPRWELCLAVSAGVRAAFKAELEVVVAADPRLRVAASAGDEANYGDAMTVAAGEVVGFLEPQDELAPEALFELVKRLGEEPEAEAVYSDEDAITCDGERRDPFFKPDWSPDLLLSTNYLARLVLVRGSLVEDLGGFGAEVGPGQVYDLLLRVTERTSRIAHVAKVLYHRRQVVTTAESVAAARAARDGERRVLEAALARRGFGGRVEPLTSTLHALRCYAARLKLRTTPLVSIIIPTRDKQHLLEQCICSILEKTDYPRYEIIVLDNNSTDPETLRYLESLPPPCRVYRCPGPFNFSKINNFGAAQAGGEHLLFLNNDVEVLRPDWLNAMMEHAQRREVGAVGAKLLYPDGRIQHAGVVVGVSGAAVHAFRLWPGEPLGHPRMADVVRNCSAVTAACMMVPRRVFEEVGGFHEQLRVAFNDIDLCLRIRRRGYLVVYTPFALLYHYEGASRGRLHPPTDLRLFQELWASVLEKVDPYYNPNLTDTRDDWSLPL